jgi:competence protein ComEA
MRSALFGSAAVLFSLLIAAPVGAQTTTQSKSPAAATATAPKSTTPQPPAVSQEQGSLVDINSASAEDLDKLPGVGPARAKAIISHRPYNGKDDLAHRKIIPQNVYDQIKDKIVARQGTGQSPTRPAGSHTAATKAK